MKDIIDLYPVYMLNSLMANFSISNDLVSKIKFAQAKNEPLQKFLTSLEQLQKENDEVNKCKGRLCVPFNELKE